MSDDDERPDWMSEAHWSLEQRVAKGIEWLTEHDPSGSFHLWFTWRLTPRSPMPAQSEDRRAEWTHYYRQRAIWEQLDAECRRLDKEEAAAA